MIDGYDGFAKFQAIKKVRNGTKEAYEYLYGLFLLEYGRWERINGVWFEHHVDEHIARRHLKRAIRSKKDTSLIEHAIGESYYRQGKLRLASSHFAVAWEKDNRLEYSFWALMETLYMHGKYQEVIERYYVYKKLKCTYSRDLEIWTELLFCYAVLHQNDTENVKQRIPLLLQYSGKLTYENDIYMLFLLGLMIYVDWVNKHEIDTLREEIHRLKYFYCQWLNMPLGRYSNMSVVR